MNDKKRWLGLIGLLVLVALVVAACGGVTPTPDATTDGSSSEVMMQNQGDAEAMDSEGSSDAIMVEDDSEEMMDSESDSDDMMKESDSEEIMGSEGDSEEGMDSESDSDDMMKEGNSEEMMGSEGDSEEMMDSEGDSDGMIKEGNSEEMMDSESDSDAMMKEGDSEQMMDDDQTMMDLPAWFSAELTDVSNGQAFSIADLEDKVVLVETMAIWCSNCLRQQKEVKALHQALGERDDLVTVVLDIDPNENAQNLKTYSEKNGFDWTYAVAPREVAREIGQLYGDQFLNPPSTPMLIIDRHGEAHPLPFGIKGVEELQESLAPFLSEGM